MLLVLFLVGVAFCLRYGPSTLPLTYDNQHYFFIAERAASGVPPHVSHFDPKHGLSMLTAAAAMRAARPLGVDDVTAARAVSIAAAAACVVLVWLLTAEVCTLPAAPWLAACAMLTFGRFFHMGAMGARPKVFLVAFALLAMLLVARRRAIAAGLASAAAFLCWQPALLFAAAGALGFAAERRFRAVASFTAAFVVANLAYEAYFVAHGALLEQIEQSYLFPGTFMKAQFPPSPSGALRRLGWVLRVGDYQPATRIVPALALAGLIALWLRAVLRAGIAWQRRRSIAIGGRVAPAAGLVCVVLAGHGALLFTLTNFQGYPDGFFVVPFMALLCGVVLAALASCLGERLGAGAGRAAAVISAAALVVVAVTTPGGWSAANGGSGRTLQDQRAAAIEVGQFLDAGMSVYAAGCTHLLAFNHATNFVPYGFFFRGLERYLVFRFGVFPYMPYRRGELPDVILASRTRMDKPESWLRERYREQPAAHLNGIGVRVWLRKSLPDTRDAG